MSKLLPYFQFEPAEYLASDISICSIAAQGLFTLMMSIYWQKDCVLHKDKFLKRYNHQNEFNELIEEGIFKVNSNGLIKIKFLDTQHHFISQRKKVNSDNGRKGAMKRIENQEVIKPDISDTSSPAQATPKHIDKIREDKIIDNIYIPETPPDKSGEKQTTSKPKKPKKEKKDLPARKLEFAEKLKPYVEKYGRPMVEEFYLFWTEHGESDKKLKFEKQSTFGIPHRLGRWNKNNFNNNNNDKNQGNNKLSYSIKTT